MFQIKTLEIHTNTKFRELGNIFLNFNKATFSINFFFREISQIENTNLARYKSKISQNHKHFAVHLNFFLKWWITCYVDKMILFGCPQNLGGQTSASTWCIKWFVQKCERVQLSHDMYNKCLCMVVVGHVVWEEKKLDKVWGDMWTP